MVREPRRMRGVGLAAVDETASTAVRSTTIRRQLGNIEVYFDLRALFA